MKGVAYIQPPEEKDFEEGTLKLPGFPVQKGLAFSPPGKREEAGTK